MVTVVIPVYKTEKYLDMCVHSVVNQTHQNLEILLIDDGSPDACPRICDEWARRDNRIRVIHKANAGLGMARNTGIDHARGQYITFLDSDDSLAPETVEKVLDWAQRQEADVTVFGFINVDEAGTELSRRVPRTERTVYPGTQLLALLLQGDRRTGLYMSACWSLFSMELVKRANWRFPSEREVLSEDVCALLRLYQYAGRAAVLPEALYSYRHNPISLSRSCRADRFAKAKCFYKKCLEICRESKYSPEIQAGCRAQFLFQTLAAMKQAPNPAHLRTILDDPLLQAVLRERNYGGWQKQTLFFAMRHKRCTLCWFMLTAKKFKDRRR